MRKYYPHILAAALFVLAIFLLFRSCGPTNEGIVTIIHDTIPGDPHPVEVPRYVPTVRWERLTDTLEMYTAADTDAIIRDYLAVRFYTDTLKNDTSLLAVVEDSVQANRIVSRRFTYQNRRPVAINTTIIHPPPHGSYIQVYVGAFGGYSPKTLRFVVGPEVSVALRPGAIVRYGYDIAGNGHQVAFGWRISFKKK